MATIRINPFASNLDYLTDKLDLLTRLTRIRRLQQVAEGLETNEKADIRDLDSPEKPRKPVAAARARERMAQWKEDLQAHERRVTKTLALGKVALPLEQLGTEHKLDAFEKNVLAVLIGADMDPGFLKALEDMGGYKRGIREIRTLLILLCDDTAGRIHARRYFVHDAALLTGGLLNLSYSRDMNSETEFMSMDLAVPRRIASLILGEQDLDEGVMAFSSVVEPEVSLDQVVLPPEKLEEVLGLVRNRNRYLEARKEWGFDRILKYGRGTVIMFCGPPGTGKTMLAHALAKEAGCRLMLADLRQVVNHSRHDMGENLQRMFHEARILNAVLFFDEADEMFTDRCANEFMPTLLREMEKMDGVCILATNRPQILDEALERRILYRMDFELPSPALREQIWRKHLPAEARIADDVDFTALAEEFEFSGGFIKNAILTAFTLVLQRPPAEQHLTHADLRNAARTQIRNRLRGQVGRVEPRAAIGDLVLPATEKRQVEEIIAATRQRQKVFSTWGFGKMPGIGRGITALFSGAPGAGKTLAAEVIAHELGYGMHAVALSSLLSQYVGETEKRIDALFADVRDDGTLLLIDEADALFGARLERDGHHAHYINQQVNVLLHALERHDGLVVLTTNRPGDFDPAFKRRIRYHIEFPQPDGTARAAIWRCQLPPAAPLAPDVDLSALARAYELTGGHIRNAVLRAAFTAATDGGVITHKMLATEAAREAGPGKESRIGFHE